MNILIRQEKEADHNAVCDLIQKAFQAIEFSDHKEQFLVNRLRKSNSFIPELSLLAEHKNKIVGHILLTKLKIINKQAEYQSLALAPLSVLPEYQRQGIGGKLIQQAHKTAKKLGYGSIILLGHENYYPRFGYEQTSKYGIKLPFSAPDKNCMIIELIENGAVSGTVEYPQEFFQ